jgi:DNA-binding transcriptional ArsR family regulator
MSAHLAVLARAGLVSAERHSRSIVYRAEVAALRGLIDFLMKDCCGGQPEICAALGSPLTSLTCIGTSSTTDGNPHG